MKYTAHARIGQYRPGDTVETQEPDELLDSFVLAGKMSREHVPGSGDDGLPSDGDEDRAGHGGRSETEVPS